MAEQQAKGNDQSNPVDVLIVGGGPAGTAAAFRASELGLSMRVIDRDTVLGILRDWVEQQNKYVDADYEECRGRPFPAGGELVAQLAFADQTLAPVLYDRWLGIYRDRAIPHHDGVELVELVQQPDGLLQAVCLDQATQQKAVCWCRTIVVAVGRGVPPKIKLMGDPSGIRYRLRAGQDFVGAPACVVGGGMAAAEAVVAIAHAKAQANDPSDVFWCYRGRSMPRVAKGQALAPRFYDAWAQGNIRYLPYSEPLAVFRDDGGNEFVAVRTRRHEQPNAPPELVCFEFKKQQVLACIGADRPDVFLGALGIGLFEAADAPQKKRLATSAICESQVRNVFLAGSLLDPAYIETSDFRSEALQSTVKEHPGCFKTAITDGVLAIQAIHARLRGNAQQRTDQAIASSVVLLRQEIDTLTVKRPGVVVAKSVQPRAELGAAFLHLGTPDQAERKEYFFPPGEVVVGRSAALPFPADGGMSDQHAAFRIDAEECYVTNETQGGKCYVRINSERTLKAGSVLSAGGQRLRVERLGDAFRLVGLDPSGVQLLVSKDETSFGRESIDPSDRALSRSHFSVADRGDVVRVRDSSRNGTYVELHGTLRLNDGDEVWMGDQRFRFVGMREGGEAGAAGAVGVAAPGAQASRAPAAERPATGVRAPVAPPAGEPAVLFPDGSKLPVTHAGPLLSFLYQAGYATSDPGEIAGKCQTLFECWEPDQPDESGGSCGKCVITVAQGVDRLNEASSREKNTIKKVNKKLNGKLDERSCRLACQARAIGGPVSIVPSGKKGS